MRLQKVLYVSGLSSHSKKCSVTEAPDALTKLAHVFKLYFSTVTNNNNSKKRQSLLNTVVIGHQRYKTANIKCGGKRTMGHSGKILANEADNMIAKTVFLRLWLVSDSD